ncbi:YihY/virulence factor BrkB family protein [Pokkaliibacter sp. CJK22405]|uniref:YihY/virulence factor BrkB family protein n=1 Tax=Pokkaliibacter sp. CJK22405 TaxID=3384615 RepID=UPI00398483A6
MTSVRPQYSLWKILRRSAMAFIDDRAMRHSAALAYYSIFSLAPLMIIAIAVAGLIFGEDAAHGAIKEQLETTLGDQASQLIENMIASTHHVKLNGFMAVLGTGLLFFSATGVFSQLKEAMNMMWGIASKPGRGVRGALLDRSISLIMVFLIGMLLIFSLLITVIIAGLSSWLTLVMPLPGIFWQSMNVLISLGVTTVLFALIFKVLPDANIRWMHVWIGAFVTAVLFTLGKIGLSLYLGREGTTSTYGAAGAMVLILMWVYYSACIFFFGAEVTQVYAEACGHNIHPNRYAIPLEDLGEYTERLRKEKTASRQLHSKRQTAAKQKKADKEAALKNDDTGS